MQWLLKHHEVLRDVILIFAVPLGLYFAHRRITTADKQARTADQQAEIAMKNHLADAYTRAIDQLGKNGEEAVQLGGLYALEKIADSNESYYRQIIEVLCAFIRLTAGPVDKKPPKLVGRKSPAPSEEKVGLTVQTALTILGRRNLDFGKLPQNSAVKIDLAGIKLCNANFYKANLSKADLREANLSEANLSGASLIGANLSGADLSMASLIEANLREANLREANLSEAYLYGTNLSRAILIEANLSAANLSGANLSEAILLEANLTGANLDEANLSGAILFEANLSEAEITVEQLQVAKVFTNTKLPDHIDPKSLDLLDPSQELTRRRLGNRQICEGA